MNNLENSTDSDHLDFAESRVESFCSELEHVEPESRENSPAERAIARTRFQEETILNVIQQAAIRGVNTLDLSNKGIIQIPEELLKLEQLEYLYLEDNELSFLPDDFFEKLHSLVWLDLRQNYLSRLPCCNLGSLTKLRNLLLEGNDLRSLPLELGLIKSLNGLNISNNPLEFPPTSVLERGTQEILKFLREMLQSKLSGQINSCGASGDFQYHKVSSSDDEGLVVLAHEGNKFHRQTCQSSSSDDRKVSDLIGPIPLSAELHQPTCYSELKLQHNEKLKKVGALGTLIRKGKKPKKNNYTQTSLNVDPHIKVSLSYSLAKILEDNNASDRKNSQTSVMSWKVNPYPEPPPADLVELKMTEERKNAKIRNIKEKQEVLLQRRRDANTLKEWRSTAKKLQEEKQNSGVVDAVDIAAGAPFGTDENHMTVMTNAERSMADAKLKLLWRPLSPLSRQQMEIEKSLRIKELERRIKEHTSLMIERRKKPKGTPQEEMELARKELEIAEGLHRELAARRMDLEYRFRAFTADII